MGPCGNRLPVLDTPHDAVAYESGRGDGSCVGHGVGVAGLLEGVGVAGLPADP
jgi:hypothetical protein